MALRTPTTTAPPEPPVDDRPAAGLTRLEPVVPLVLAVHASATVLLDDRALLLLPALGGLVVLALLGVAGWRSRAAVVTRAAASVLLALGVQVVEPVMVPAMLQWYYAVATVYALLLSGAVGAAVGPLVAGCYLLQVLLGAGAVPAPVALLRAGVLTALGLIAYRAGAAYRRAARDAERGRREAERAGSRLAHQATHDELTGLPNRVLFRAHLQAAVAAPGSPGTALLLLDLDRFKEVNDTLGHRYGDLLLEQVARRLAEHLGTSGTVARLGGDEFAVVLPGVHDVTDAVVAAGALRSLLVEPFALLEAVVVVDVSIGIALAPEHGTDDDRLLQHADVAMYTAKAAGSGCAVYDPASDRHAADQLTLLGELRAALDHHELVVHYQPQVELRSGTVLGLEALVRWQHPRRGLLGPDVFVALAERSGLVDRLTDVVLEDALRQCRHWAEAGTPVAVSVNLSARSLTEPDLPDRISRALARWDVPPERLELEITESFVMTDPGRAQALLRQVHRMGVRLAIDDFGTGLSSLSYLKDLPVDVLKVDKSFVQHASDDGRLVVLLQGIVALADGLGLRTVAEGVEDAVTLEVLRRIGCAAAQGYHLARPMTGADADAWLARTGGRLPVPPDDPPGDVPDLLGGGLPAPRTSPASAQPSSAASVKPRA